MHNEQESEQFRAYSSEVHFCCRL